MFSIRTRGVEMLERMIVGHGNNVFFTVTESKCTGNPMAL